MMEYTEIEVCSQNELDAVPDDFYGEIHVRFGTRQEPAMLRKRWNNARAALGGNAHAVLRNNAQAVLEGNAHAELRDNAYAVLRDDAYAVLWGNARAELWDNARAVLKNNANTELRDNACAVLWGNAHAELRDNAHAELRDNAHAELRDNAYAVLRDDAYAVLWGNARAELWDNARAELWGNACAEAAGNAQLLMKSGTASAQISGNARTIREPETPQEYVKHHGLTCWDGNAVVYKAVHKKDGRYISDHDPMFSYEIGKTAAADGLNTDPDDACGYGIHAAHKAWCVDYGGDWSDLAILEVEMPMDTMVVPKNCGGKVRADRVTVVREVPLEECGMLGQWMAERRTHEHS